LQVGSRTIRHDGLMLYLDPGQQSVAQRASMGTPDRLAFVVNVINYIVLVAQLAARRGGPGHRSPIAISQNRQVAVHV
jgi:hypothetical protein